MTTNLTAALYLRSSKDRSDVSIDAQRRELTTLAAQRGLLIAIEYTDAVESGKTDQRPGFQAMLRDLKTPTRTWSHLLMVDTSRLSRRRYVAQAFKHECRKRGVIILYAKVPETDPVTSVILDAVFEAMDEVHSLMSRMKGLAGMAENVRQGFRAGGRAPLGYRLKVVHTGTMRDGSEVTKSQLDLDEHAHAIGRYLRARAAGVPRVHAQADAAIKKAATSLIGIEWNALTYAGCTVWNVHAERIEGMAVGGRKRRPRGEWLVQEGTHEALITREEAERLLQQLETSTIGQAVARGKAAASESVLSGLLRTPAGKAWHSDGDGSYRVTGRRVGAQAIESAVREMFYKDLRSPAFIRTLANQARRAADGDEDPARELRLEVIGINGQIDKAMKIAMELATPGPALRQIDQLEARRNVLALEISRREAEYAQNHALAVLTEENIRTILDQFIEDMQTDDRRELKRVLGAFVDRIELNPDNLESRIHYRIAVDSGESLASPRGAEGFPGANRTGIPALVAVSIVRQALADRRA